MQISPGLLSIKRSHEVLPRLNTFPALTNHERSHQRPNLIREIHEWNPACLSRRIDIVASFERKQCYIGENR
jgi:hypothetical protein